MAEGSTPRPTGIAIELAAAGFTDAVEVGRGDASRCGGVLDELGDVFRVEAAVAPPPLKRRRAPSAARAWATHTCVPLSFRCNYSIPILDGESNRMEAGSGHVLAKIVRPG